MSWFSMVDGQILPSGFGFIMCNQILALAGIAIYFLTHAMPLSQVAPRMHRWLWTVDTVGYLWFGIFGLDLLRSCVQRRWEGNQASYDARPAKLCSKAALVQRSLRWSSSSSIRSPDPPARIRTMYIDSKQCTVARSVFLVESESKHFQFIECLWFNCELEPTLCPFLACFFWNPEAISPRSLDGTWCWQTGLGRKASCGSFSQLQSQGAPSDCRWIL